MFIKASANIQLEYFLQTNDVCYFRSLVKKVSFFSCLICADWYFNKKNKKVISKNFLWIHFLLSPTFTTKQNKNKVLDHDKSSQHKQATGRCQAQTNILICARKVTWRLYFNSLKKLFKTCKRNISKVHSLINRFKMESGDGKRYYITIFWFIY